MSSNCVLGSGSTMLVTSPSGPSLARAKSKKKFSYPVSETRMSPGAVVSRPLRLRGGPLRNRYALITSSLRPENGGFGQNSFRIGEKDGLIIVDHGSRRRESNLMLNEFVAIFRDKTGYPVVEPAHMELADPSIKDAFRSCVQQGVTRVIVSPFFLFPGRHWHKDVVNDRIKHCLSHVEGDADECEVCAGTGKCKIY